ncbi:hypothetical protein [Oceanirhabdus seepicola]|uniref:Uncharacterized protein n=1 Tax=Oceanirhabdus seepicola TaxID=2828781 RepID=A0A9J6NZ98_9CLOT|nr:hypothetical protein [Oceanirhabdus seepicola]MCM1988925.1 hypothetical protein [Oceanirhabdus seepicola]
MQIKKRIGVSIFLIAMFIIFIRYTNDIHFVSQTGFDNYDVNRKYYLGFNMHKEGFINCKIKNCWLVDKNGNRIKNEDIHYKFYIDESKTTGAVSKELSFKPKASYKDIKNYAIKTDNPNLDLEIYFDKNSNTEFIQGIKITYSFLGIPKSKIKKIESFEVDKY